MSCPFHFFASDISNFEDWTEESQRLFCALFRYHLPNIVDYILADSWKAHLKHLFILFTSTLTSDDYTNIINLTSLGSSFISRSGVCTSSGDTNIHRDTLQRMRKYRIIGPRQNALALNFVDDGFIDVDGKTYFIDIQGILMMREEVPTYESEVSQCISTQNSADIELEVRTATNCKKATQLLIRFSF